MNSKKQFIILTPTLNAKFISSDIILDPGKVVKSRLDYDDDGNIITISVVRDFEYFESLSKLN